MAFHWKDNWYFERLEKGVVRMYHLDDHGIADEDLEIDADSWASIAASVSARGETGETFQEAREFHAKQIVRVKPRSPLGLHREAAARRAQEEQLRKRRKEPSV